MEQNSGPAPNKPAKPNHPKPPPAAPARPDPHAGHDMGKPEKGAAK